MLWAGQGIWRAAGMGGFLHKKHVLAGRMVKQPNATDCTADYSEIVKICDLMLDVGVKCGRVCEMLVETLRFAAFWS